MNPFENPLEALDMVRRRQAEEEERRNFGSRNPVQGPAPRMNPPVEPRERRMPLQQAGRIGMGGLRLVAGALEPLQLPQEVLMAVTAGALDPNTTIMDRLKQVEWAKFAPWGASPNRAATGDEILGFLGVADENARKWGGLALDLTYDPLMAGSFLRVLGSATRSTQLINFGKNIDNATSIAGMYRGLAKMPGFKQFNDAAIGKTLELFQNPEATFMGIRGGNLTWAMDKLLSKRTMANLKLGSELGNAAMKAATVSRSRGMDAGVLAFDVMAETYSKFMSPTDKVNLAKRVMNTLSGNAQAQAKAIAGLPTVAAEAVHTAAYRIAEDVSYLATLNKRKIGKGTTTFQHARAGTTAVGQDAVENAKMFMNDPIGRELFETFNQIDIQQLGKNIPNTLDFQRRMAQEVDTIMANLQKAGIKGVDRAKVNSALMGVAESQVYTSAMLGYHFSGFDFVKRNFYTEAAQLGLSVDQIETTWKKVLSTGLKGGDISGLPIVGLHTLQGRQRRVGDILMSKDSAFADIQLSTYLTHLAEGHMPIMYGMFADAKDVDRFARAVTQGKMIPTNVIDQTTLQQVTNVKHRDLIDTFVKAKTQAANKDTLIRKYDLAQHLVENGLTPREAEKTIMELLSGNANMQQFLNDLYDVKARFDTVQRGVIGQGSGSAFEARNALSDAEKLQLGEYMNTFVSMTETAQVAKRRLPLAEQLRDTYDFARQKGYVRPGDVPYVDAMGTRYELIDPSHVEQWGAFAGQRIHPHLKDMLEKAMAGGKGGGAFGRIRSMLTGSYLASPNVIAANVIGGIYTATAAGVPTNDMMAAMARNFKALAKTHNVKQRANFDLLDRLSNYMEINKSGLVESDVIDFFLNERLQRIGVGVGEGGIQAAAKNLEQFYQGLLRKPLGQRWAGLEGFQFTENWMKVSAYDATRRRLAKQAGIALSELDKPFAEMSDLARKLDAQAAEVARIAIFDYSELPDSVRFLRDTGFLMFPGFSYFLIGRTMNAAVNRPGVLAMAERLPEAITNAVVGDESRDAQTQLYFAMAPWLREQAGVPIRSWINDAGENRHSVIPFNQLIPTKNFAGQNFTESITRMGLWGPLAETIAALIEDDGGEAMFSGRYGKRIYQQDAQGIERFAQAGGFLLEAFSPGFIRKTAEVGTSLSQALSPEPMPQSLAKLGYSWDELQSGRIKRRMGDSLISAFLRSPQVLTTDGILDSVRRQYGFSESEKSRKVGLLKNKFGAAVIAGNTTAQDHLMRRIMDTETEFMETWQPYLNTLKPERRRR